MPIRLCSEPRCPNAAEYRGRCKPHARSRERQTHSNKAFYNTAKWRNTRRRVLLEQPLCDCGHIAVDVHHIIAIEDGGTPFARSNLKALCKTCHGKLTKQELQHRSSH